MDQPEGPEQTTEDRLNQTVHLFNQSVAEAQRFSEAIKTLEWLIGYIQVPRDHFMREAAKLEGQLPFLREAIAAAAARSTEEGQNQAETPPNGQEALMPDESPAGLDDEALSPLAIVPDPTAELED